MTDLESLNETIKREATEILHNRGLFSVLAKYGDPVLWGSFALDLMTWRDLDIYLESSVITEPDFFRLGSEISVLLKPHRMHFRNEFIGKAPGLPEGLYWGIYADLPDFPGQWKIDIWMIDSRQLQVLQKEFQVLQSKITVKNRSVILAIKHRYWNHSEYRRSFTSMDIYHSVCDEGVTSVGGFTRWLKENRGISVE